MADLPPGATKKVIGELAEEGVEKIAKEAVEEVSGEGVEKITREAGEEARGIVAREADGFIPASLPGPSKKTADNSLSSFDQFRQGYKEEGMEYLVRNFENPGIHRDLINPHPDATGHCTSVALATDSIAAGGDNWVMSIDYARATNSLDQRQLLDFNLAYLEAGGVGHRALGGDELFEEMLKRGDGSRALVFIKGADNVPGHVVNVVNVGGTVKFLDGQSGKTFGTLDELLEGRPFSDLILTDPMNGFVAPGTLPDFEVTDAADQLILGKKPNPHTSAQGISSGTNDAYVGNARGGGGSGADIAYVQKATGSPDGSRSLWVKDSRGKYTEVDWYEVDSSGDIKLLDAKNSGDNSIYDVTRTDKFYIKTEQANKIVAEAKRQTDAAKTLAASTGHKVTVEWRVANKEIKDNLTDLLKKKRIRINVVYVSRG